MRKQSIVTCMCVITFLGAVYSQSNPQLLSNNQELNFENCGCPTINLLIYNGLDGASGGQMIDDDLAELEVGAVTIANLNDTDGDDNIDWQDTHVSSDGVGRDEVDLMRLDISPLGELTENCPASLNLDFTGPLQFWMHSTKGEPITDLNFNVADLPLTIWVEAIDHSAAPRDLIIKANYDGIEQDEVRATAVWVENRRNWYMDDEFPIAGQGDLAALDGSELTCSINEKWISLNGQRYGYGPFQSGSIVCGNPSLGVNTKIGGRIVFEFELLPAGVESLVYLDITRQIKQRTYFFEEFRPFFELTSEERFLWELDVPNSLELPNDDTQNSTDEDNIPNSSLIYSADPPGPRHLANTPDGSPASYFILRATFKEFARVRLGAPYSTGAALEEVDGGIASDKVDWHCVSNFIRNSEGEFEADNTNGLVVSAPRFQGAGNGSVSFNLASTTPTMGYRATYQQGTDRWYLTDPAGNGTYIEASISQTVWTAEYNGIDITITQGDTPFSNKTMFYFSVYNPETDKYNRIALGAFENVEITP